MLADPTSLRNVENADVTHELMQPPPNGTCVMVTANCSVLTVMLLVHNEPNAPGCFVKKPSGSRMRATLSSATAPDESKIPTKNRSRFSIGSPGRCYGQSR